MRPSCHRFPLHSEPLPTRSTLPQIQLNERSGRNPCLFRERLEVAHGLFVKLEPDFFLQPLGIQGQLGLGKVIMFSHCFHRLHRQRAAQYSSPRSIASD